MYSIHVHNLVNSNDSWGEPGRTGRTQTANVPSWRPGGSWVARNMLLSVVLTTRVHEAGEPVA
jgi:hypothetical protein